MSHPDPLRSGRLAIAAVLLGMVPGRVAAQDDCLTITDFAKDPVGAFPPDWKVRKDEGKSVYTVREEAGRRFVRAVSKGLGIQAALAYEWNLDAYRSWRGPGARASFRPAPTNATSRNDSRCSPPWRWP